ncbi:MAG: sulfotransferase family protein [Phycisphaerales bacterium]
MRPTRPVAVAPGRNADSTVGFVFLTGAQKSGTTWVERTLNRHPEVVFKGESWFFGPDCDVDHWLDDAAFDEWTRLPLGRFLSNVDSAELKDAAKRGMVEALLRLRWRPGVRWIGDRTPYFYCRRVERMHALFPDARLITVIRDPRDVAVSHMFHLLRENRLRYMFDDADEAARVRRFHIEGDGPPLPLFTDTALRHFAERWSTAVEASRRAQTLFGANHLELRYEDAVRDDSAFVALFEFLELGDGEIIRRCIDEARFERESAGRPRGVADPASFWRKGVVGDWRNYFTSADLRLYQTLLGPLMNDYGYGEG